MALNNSLVTSIHGNSSWPFEKNYTVVWELLPIAVTIVLTNGLVFVLFMKQSRLRTAANYMLLSLAVCDFFTGSVNIPLTIMASVHAIPYPAASALFYALPVLHCFTAVATGYHILVITLERYLCLVCRVKCTAKKNKIWKVLGCVWATSTIIACVPLFWKTDARAKNAKGNTLQISYAIFCLVVVFVLPYSFIVYAYTVMFRTIIRTRKQHNVRQRCEDNGLKFNRDRHSTNERRCLVIFVTMAILYLVCWLPWFTLILILASNPSAPIDKYATVSRVVVLFRYFTSAINPALYTFLKRDFYVTFKEVFLRKKEEAPLSLSGLSTVRRSSLENE